MLKKIFIFAKILALCIILILAIGNYFSIQTKAAEELEEGMANIVVSPNPAPKGTELNISIEGKGAGKYSFCIVPQGTSCKNGITPSVVFKVDENGCNINEFNARYNNPKPTCEFNSENKVWNVKLTHIGTLTSNSYDAKLTRPNQGGYNRFTTFIVGEPKTSKLKVTISPEGPLKNHINNEITINWSPVEKGEKFYILTNLTTRLALSGIITCDTEPECSTNTIIPKAVPGGDLTFTVIQDGQTDNRGNGSVNIEAVIPPDAAEAAKAECLEDKKNPCTQASGQLCEISTGESVTSYSIKDDKGVKKVNYKTKSGKEILLENVGVMTAVGCVPSQPKTLVSGVLKFITFASGGIALILMFFGAFNMVTSAGNPENLKKANDQFVNAVIGLLFILFSVLLLQVIGVDILDIPGFGK